MVTKPTRLVRIGAASCAVALLVSCSSSGSGDAATSTTTTAKQTTTTTTEPEVTTTTEPGTDADTEAKLATLLITADDLGPTFVELDASDSDEGPCGGDIDADFPPLVHAQGAFQSEELQVAMQQDLRVFESETEAATAFDGFVESVSCGSDTVDQSLQLGEPTDVTSDVGQKAVAVSLTGDGVEGVGIVVHYSDVIATYQFQGVTGADTSSLPAPLEIAAANIAEIVDQIG